MKPIETIRDRHKGEEIWVIGMGPSIDDLPDNFFKDKISIVVSHYEAFPDFTYILCKDVIKDIGNQHPEFLDRCIVEGTKYRGQIGDKANKTLYMRENDDRSSLQEDKWVEFAKCIMEKRNDCLYGGAGTILHSALMAAIVMGAKRVILVGGEARTTKDRFYSKRISESYEKTARDSENWNGVQWCEDDQKGLVDKFPIYRNGTILLARVFRPYGIKILEYYHKSKYEFQNGFRELADEVFRKSA